MSVSNIVEHQFVTTQHNHVRFSPEPASDGRTWNDS